MFFERKIYCNNKPLILTNSAEQYMLQHPDTAGYLFLKGALPRNFRIAQKLLNSAEGTGALIEDTDVDALKAGLKSVFLPVEAAGGVVSNPQNEVLMIYRRGKWDLPKGKRDDGEQLSECALREVREETGLPEALHLGDKICTTYHVYAQDDREMLKTTHWYQMDVPQPYLLTPQEEEDILEAKWVNEQLQAQYLDQSYHAVREVLEAWRKMA